MNKSFCLIIGVFLAVLAHVNAVRASDFTTEVAFPVDFEVGDYVEFAKLNPIDAGASGFYEVSLSYTRNSVAAAATFYVSLSHSNAGVWREAGRVNSNSYVIANNYNFTIDCNTGAANRSLRVRAINTLGVKERGINVNIKIRSINFDTGITALNLRGKETNPVKLLPMTDEWCLYVGEVFDGKSAEIAIKAIANGNVGIGTATPNEKLAVNGNIRAKEIKVEATNWPDYVFKPEYNLMPLTEVEQHIQEYGHLPDVPKASQIEEEGLSVSEMNKLMMKKIEELTLHLIEKDKELQRSNHRLIEVENKQKELERLISKMIIKN